jgi:Casein kinase II regulatory subunit
MYRGGAYIGSSVASSNKDNITNHHSNVNFRQSNNSALAKGIVALDEEDDDEENDGWISHYLRMPGNSLFCEVECEYIRDRFNLTDLPECSHVSEFRHAHYVLLDNREAPLPRTMTPSAVAAGALALLEREKARYAAEFRNCKRGMNSRPNLKRNTAEYNDNQRLEYSDDDSDDDNDGAEKIRENSSSEDYQTEENSEEDDDDDEDDDEDESSLSSIESVASLTDLTAAVDAARLYGLIHARFITTTRGLHQVASKMIDGEYGTCPRVLCVDAPLLPYGPDARPGISCLHFMCTNCRDIYAPTDPLHFGIDGAYWGPTVASLLLLCGGEGATPLPLPPRLLLLFKIHPSSDSDQVYDENFENSTPFDEMRSSPLKELSTDSGSQTNFKGTAEHGRNFRLRCNIMEKGRVPPVNSKKPLSGNRGNQIQEIDGQEDDGDIVMFDAANNAVKSDTKISRKP